MPAGGLLNIMPEIVTSHSVSSSDSICLLASAFHTENSRTRLRSSFVGSAKKGLFQLKVENGFQKVLQKQDSFHFRFGIEGMSFFLSLKLSR